MENNILIWLTPIVLLPIFFGMGWLAARIDMKAVLTQAKIIPWRIYQSLDALIDNKTSLAAASLSEIIEAGDDSLTAAENYELALTLGKLWRRRGENDKAIALHQKLLGNAGAATPEQFALIHYELGKDYQSAGLVDRAENELEQLLDSPYRVDAARELLLIYQQDRDWQKAIDLAVSLPAEDFTQHIDIAQFYCELAQKALIESRLNVAENYIQQALKINKKCARANIILGDLRQKSANYTEAIAAFCAIENQNYAYLAMVGERIFDAYAAMDKKEEGLNLLIGYSQTFPQLNLSSIIHEKALILWGKEKADTVTAELIRANPDLEKIYLLTAITMDNSDPISKTDADIIKKVLAGQISRSFMYQCKHCYFKSQVFFWRCPACGKWETFTPNRIEI